MGRLRGLSTVAAGIFAKNLFSAEWGGGSQHQAIDRVEFDAGGPGCFRCHWAGGRGTAGIGPDLSSSASVYDKAELIRSVLEPSSRVAPGWSTVVIALRDGSTKEGIIRSETPGELVLVDSNAQVSRVSKTEIVERRPARTSLMPSGLVDALSPIEFADLIAYLETLKAAARAARKP